MTLGDRPSARSRGTGPPGCGRVRRVRTPRAGAPPSTGPRSGRGATTHWAGPVAGEGLRGADGQRLLRVTRPPGGAAARCRRSGARQAEQLVPELTGLLAGHPLRDELRPGCCSRCTARAGERTHWRSSTTESGSWTPNSARHPRPSSPHCVQPPGHRLRSHSCRGSGVRCTVQRLPGRRGSLCGAALGTACAAPLGPRRTRPADGHRPARVQTVQLVGHTGLADCPGRHVVRSCEVRSRLTARQILWIAAEGLGSTASHSRTVLSSLAVARVLPSGLNVTAFTEFVCPVRVVRVLPVAGSHIETHGEPFGRRLFTHRLVDPIQRLPTTSRLAVGHAQIGRAHV